MIDMQYVKLAMEFTTLRYLKKKTKYIENFQKKIIFHSMLIGMTNVIANVNV
jgi:hypothetical protein